MRHSPWAAVCFLVVNLACESGGVGDPCVPEEEVASTFGGFSLFEVNVESGSFQCETRLCLVNHFQGRVSCPAGQTERDLDLSVTDPSRCRIPGTDGTTAADAVGVPVEAWDLDRPADRAVYCSCRCAGPDDGARYCKCPSGFECLDLVPNTGTSGNQLVGSYCVREGTEFEPGEIGGPTCREQPDDAACSSSPLLGTP